MLIHREVKLVRSQQKSTAEAGPADTVLFLVIAVFALIAAGLCS